MSATSRTTLAACIAEIAPDELPGVILALRDGKQLLAEQGAAPVAAWYGALGELLQHSALMRRGTAVVAVDAVGVMRIASSALTLPQIDAVAVSLLLNAQDNPHTPIGDLFYNLALLLDEEKLRRFVPGADDGSRHPL